LIQLQNINKNIFLFKLLIQAVVFLLILISTTVFAQNSVIENVSTNGLLTENTEFKGTVILFFPLIAVIFLCRRIYILEQQNRKIKLQIAEQSEKSAEINHQLTQEVTKRKEIQHNLKLLEMAVTQTDEGIAIADMDGYNQFVNRAWTDMHGYTQEELSGTHMSRFHTGEQYETQVKPFIEQVMKAGHYHGEDIHIKKDGTLLNTWMSVNAVKNDEDQPIAVVGVCRDITLRLKNRNKLKKAKEAAENANRAKSVFLATNMSHELRTPLNAKLGFSQLLQQSTNFEDSERNDLKIINKSGNHLLNLINQVLDFSKIEAGHIS